MGTGFLSFGLWVHHMFTTGLPGISLGLFSAASEAVAIPTGVQIFCFIATSAAGRMIHSVPMLFTFGGLAIFVLGGLTGVMVALAPFDFQAHDSFFVVGHLHYVLVGGAIFPVVAACYYYFPLIEWQKALGDAREVAFWAIFIGFNITFLPMHFAGLRGMPRRVFTYPAEMGFDLMNLVSSGGAFILGAGFALVAWDIIRPKGRQPLSKRNPWNAGTLEWLAEMPAKPWGVRSIPEIDSRYPLWDQPSFMRDVDQGRFYLPDAEEGLRETLVRPRSMRSRFNAYACRATHLSPPGRSYLRAASSFSAPFICGGPPASAPSPRSASSAIGYGLRRRRIPEKPEKALDLA